MLLLRDISGFKTTTVLWIPDLEWYHTPLSQLTWLFYIGEEDSVIQSQVKWARTEPTFLLSPVGSDGNSTSELMQEFSGADVSVDSVPVWSSRFSRESGKRVNKEGTIPGLLAKVYLVKKKACARISIFRLNWYCLSDADAGQFKEVCNILLNKTIRYLTVGFFFKKKIHLRSGQNWKSLSQVHTYQPEPCKRDTVPFMFLEMPFSVLHRPSQHRPLGKSLFIVLIEHEAVGSITGRRGGEKGLDCSEL